MFNSLKTLSFIFSFLCDILNLEDYKHCMDIGNKYTKLLKLSSYERSSTVGA